MRSSSQPPLRWLTVTWATTLATLIGVTWPLWTPMRSGVPRVSFAPVPEAAAVFLGFALLTLMAIQLLATLAGKASRWSLGAVTLALAAWMALDQLRWQPWAYHALVVGAALATLDTCRALFGLRAVAIAVYAFSALSKIDAEFVATLGSQMAAMLGAPEPARPTVAFTLPLGELALAGLLAASLKWRRLAWPACAAAVAMHVTTIAVLSPWGLGHNLSVLAWNAGFACQTALLFAPTTSLSEREPLRRSGWLGLAACGVAALAPAATHFGLWDNWPGWALYSPGGERASLFVDWSAAGRLPPSLRRHVDEQNAVDPTAGWRRVRLADWVLTETRAPLYPQNRVTAALASGLVDRGGLAGQLLLVLESPANRFTRERTRVELTDPEAIRNASRLLGIAPQLSWSRRP